MDVTEAAVRDDVLYFACKQADVNTVEQLVHAGLPECVVNYRDQSGLTSLMVAAISGSDFVVSLLLRIPCVDVNAGDNEGNTPLMFAAEAGHYVTLETLLHSSDIDIDKQNQNGFTALMKAAVQGRLDCIHLLLQTGASCAIKDFGRCFCAYEWAKFCGRRLCAKTIMEISKKLQQSKEQNGKRSLARSDSFSEPDLSRRPSYRKVSFARLGAIVVNLFRLRDKRLIADLDKSPLAYAARCASTPLLPALYTDQRSPVFPKKIPKSPTLPEIKVTSYISRTESLRRTSTKRRQRQREPLSPKNSV